MILLKLISKEIKQFFRNKTDVTTMFLFPIVLIVVMSIALNGLMNVEQNIFKGKDIYYSTNGLSSEEDYIEAFEVFKQNFEEITDTRFIKIDSKINAKEAVDKGVALTFIDIEKDNYYMYRGNNKESGEQKIFKSVFEQYLNKYALNTIAMNEINSDVGTITNKEELKNILETESNIVLVKEGVKNKGINSYTYYTFSELVLIILYISSVTSVSMYKENYLNTMSRFRVSNISYFSIILSKSILGILIGIIQIFVVYMVSTTFLNVNWGNDIHQIIIVLIGLIVFSSTLGIASSLIFKDQKSASIVCNMIIIVMGLLGGSYMPISLIKSIDITNILCQITPTYWANISLLSLSSGINTSYPQISLIVSLGLSIIMIFIALLFNKFRAGGKHVKFNFK